MYLAPTLHSGSSPLQLSLTCVHWRQSWTQESSRLWLMSSFHSCWALVQILIGRTMAEALGAAVQRSVLYACAQCHRVETFQTQWTRRATSMCLSLSSCLPLLCLRKSTRMIVALPAWTRFQSHLFANAMQNNVKHAKFFFFFCRNIVDVAFSSWITLVGIDRFSTVSGTWRCFCRPLHLFRSQTFESALTLNAWAVLGKGSPRPKSRRKYKCSLCHIHSRPLRSYLVDPAGNSETLLISLKTSLTRATNHLVSHKTEEATNSDGQKHLLCWVCFS